MLIYIVRHGETRANVKGYLQGWSDDPLNENGIKLAEITGQKMKGTKFDFCISSPLTRAKETAEILLRESNNRIPIAYDERIREINFGDYEYADIKDPRIQQFFIDPFQCHQFPNGESIQMLMERTQAFYKELTLMKNNKTILVVTHGCALRAMLNNIYDNPADYWHGHVPYNCCVNVLKVANEKTVLVADDMVMYPIDMMVDRYK